MAVSTDELKGLYYNMNLVRQVDERCRRLFKQGRFQGTYFSAVGQEATVVGPCYGLRPDDFIGIQHREIGAVITKGLPIKYLMAQLFARKDSPDRGKSHPCHYGWKPMGIVTPASTIAAQTVIVTGSALAWKIQKKDNVAVAFVGEGATSNGVWHEALNFAGVHSLPIVFIVQDNLWAESVPKRLGVPLDNLSERAKAYGFPGVTIDGNDLIACYETSQEAVRKARRGEGPTLIEMKTYRWYGHSEIDPANYRTSEELEMWKKRDPVPRFEKLLMERGVVDEAHKQATLQRIEREIEEAIDFAEKSPHPDPEEILEDVYAPLN
ncbi:MAG TPA: thiamine pyrophosphate-dependent dehydrogenase E1 component subunit alpha [Candidatus Eisenbacteria bacterium]|nr:thiamine pyrophosphate-dependent dehydrogenase E1 component subunit alpha [Candidatus Eisenbacteria bacterium]